MELFFSLLGLIVVVAARSVSIPNDLAKSYAPVHVACPPRAQWLREANGLSPEEAFWVHDKKVVVTEALRSYLERLELQDFDVSKYIGAIKSNDFAHVPILGFLISGGGWASAFTGTGALRALDSRLDAANDQKTGGLLQSTTYLSGESGGSWPVMSLAQYDFPSIDELVKNWQPDISRLSLQNETKYTGSAESIFKDLAAKAKAGFDVGMGDFLGRAIGYQFIPGDKGGLAATFSEVTSKSKFKNHEMPLPIIQLNEIDPSDPEFFGLPLAPFNANIFDVTPFEFGAWQGVKSFFPMKYIGTAMENGSPVNDTACVEGFDRASFVIGSSEDAFNMWEIETLSNYTLGSFSKRTSASIDDSESLYERDKSPTKEITPIVQAFNQNFGLNESQIAPAYWPNPFAGVSSVSPAAAQKPLLRLVDGSESLQGLPFWGQIQPARGLNFILAWDDSQDTFPYNWLNGTTIYNTYLRAKAESLPFPIIPDVSTMINRKYNIRPTFFGCDANLTTTKSAEAPIVVYMANAPYSAYTNYTYTQTNTSNSQFDDIMVNSFNQVTQANSTLDSDWPACLGCAAIDRSLPRVGMQRTVQCEACMARYCWDGTEDNASPPVVDPYLVLQPDLGFVEWRKTHNFQNDNA